MFQAICFEFHSYIGVSGLQSVDGILQMAEMPVGQEVIIFHHGAVVKSDAMVGAAARDDRSFFEETQARSGFAGVENACAGATDGVDVAAGERGDAR